MTPATIQFSPSARSVLARLQDTPKLRVQLLRALDRENQQTVGHIAKRYLSKRGPDTLGVVTNRLRSSLWAAKARVAFGYVLSAIGTNVGYAGVHEYGFDGEVQVRAFTRRNPQGDRYRHVRVIGEFDLATGAITRRAARKKTELVASGISRVKAHTRHAHYAVRAPIRRGILDRQDAYAAAVERAGVAYLQGGAT